MEQQGAVSGLRSHLFSVVVFAFLAVFLLGVVGLLLADALYINAGAAHEVLRSE
jgi:hypothetical protein